MRKNYFAKKLIAYSMAFAVAFSTLTVSPVFVKEVKAASGTVTLPAGTDATANDGKVIVNTINTVNAGNITFTEADLKSKLGINATDLVNGAQINDTAKVTGATYATAYSIAKTTGFSQQKGDPVKSVDEGIAFDGKERSVAPTDATKESTLGNKKVEVSSGLTDAAHGVQWYKLVPSETTVEVPYLDGTTTKTEVAKVKYWTLVAENAFEKANDDTKLYFEEVTPANLGLYLAVKLDSNGLTTDSTDYALVNLYEASDTTVTATPATVKGIVGGNAVVEVTVKSTKKDLTYSWTRGGTKLPQYTSNRIELTNLTNADFGTYKCTVNDTIRDVSANVTLTLDGTNASTVKDKMTNIYTDVVALDTDDTLLNDKLSLTTSIPSNADYRYVWQVVGKKISTLLTENDVMSYDGTNKNITINDKTSNNITTVKCYAVSVEKYNELFKTKLDAVADASANTKYAALCDLIDTAAAGSSSDALFTETFTLGKDDTSTIKTSEVKVVKVGGSFEMTAPTVEGTTNSSQLTLNGGSPLVDKTDATVKSYKVNTASYSDFGKYVWTVSNGTDTAIHTLNVIYVSDLTASATDVTSKLQVKDLELKVNATSSLPLSYTWKFVKNADTDLDDDTPTAATDVDSADFNTINATIDNNVVKIGTLADDHIYIPEVKKEDPTQGNKVNEANYFVCEVTDGVATRTVTIKVNKVVPFTVYGPNGKELVATTNDTFAVKGIKDREYTFAPKVDVAEGEEVTYKWTKGSSATTLSTDPTFTITYDGTTPTYNCTITDKNNKYDSKVVKYSVTTMSTTSVGEATDNYKVTTKDLVYTGEELEGVVSVEHLNGLNPDFTLVKDVDYTVTYDENINVGIARATINFIGKFEKVTETKGKLTATFLIDRADNELKVEDKTVVLGGSVQPKTTNKAGAPVAYVYYADADCTTEIAVPTKVGTYYVKATSIATTNYNQAESNVAKVVIVPGKVKMLGTSRTASSVKLNWNKTTGATSYRVYYKAPGAKSYKVFKNTTATRMNVTGLASATTYTFAVKAYAKTAGYSKVYATKKTTTAPAKVATPSVTTGSKKATVKFTKVARATGYQIYMTKGNGKYVKVKTTTSTSFTKTGLAKGATYKFKVRAYKTVGSNTYYGAFSSAKAVVVK